MKKLLFVLAFAFIGQQSFSQMYMVVLSDINQNHPSGLDDGFSGNDGVMTVIDPSGNATYTHLPDNLTKYDPTNMILINQKLNNIISLGYKIVGINPQGHMSTNQYPSEWTQVFFLAIP
jgi:hypothetical protein